VHNEKRASTFNNNKEFGFQLIDVAIDIYICVANDNENLSNCTVDNAFDPIFSP